MVGFVGKRFLMQCHVNAAALPKQTVQPRDKPSGIDTGSEDSGSGGIVFPYRKQVYNI